MRAGPIIGGIFLVFFGSILTFTRVGIIVGVSTALIGFIMLIVGLFTNEPKRLYPRPQIPQRVVVARSPPKQVLPPPAPPAPLPVVQPTRVSLPEPIPLVASPQQEVLAICPSCKARIPAISSFCLKCGMDLREKVPA